MGASRHPRFLADAARLADDVGQGAPAVVSAPAAPLARADLLTVFEAKAIVVGRGWTNGALARWWGYRAEHISRIIHDPNRKRHFDDALRGLPHAAEVGQ